MFNTSSTLDLQSDLHRELFARSSSRLPSVAFATVPAPSARNTLDQVMDSRLRSYLKLSLLLFQFARRILTGHGTNGVVLGGEALIKVLL